MFGLSYFKGLPTDYILKYTGGTVGREGPGLSFYYFRYNTQIVAVPTASSDASFVFNELTSNFQTVTIQGQFTWRITDPKKVAQLLNFTIDPLKRTNVSNDPEKLVARIANIIQIETRGEIQKRSLERTLGDAQTIASAVLSRMKEAVELKSIGVELISVYFLSTRPSSEVAKALEAEYRETLLGKADEAIYARRAASVDEERKIKEKELASDRAIEEQRKALIVLQGDNSRQEAENRAQALEIDSRGRAKALEIEGQAKAVGAEMELAVYRAVDPRMLLALSMKTLGENAGSIGNLTITTELLASLLNGRPENS